MQENTETFMMKTWKGYRRQLDEVPTGQIWDNLNMINNDNELLLIEYN